MESKVKKGTNFESQIRERLKRRGFEVDFKPKPVFVKYGKQRFFSKNKDLFSLWDIIAIKEGQVSFIQVKSSEVGSISGVSDFKKKASEFMKKHGKHNKYYIVWKDTTNNLFRTWKWVNDWEEIELKEMME